MVTNAFFLSQWRLSVLISHCSEAPFPSPESQGRASSCALLACNVWNAQQFYQTGLRTAESMGETCLPPPPPCLVYYLSHLTEAERPISKGQIKSFKFRELLSLFADHETKSCYLEIIQMYSINLSTAWLSTIKWKPQYKVLYKLSPITLVYLGYC